MFFINFVDAKVVRRFWSLSIRAKIILLVALALTVSLCSYLYIGTSLIVGDKVSYIYDYNLSQSRLAAQNFDSWLSKIITNTRMIGAFVGSTNKNEAFGNDLFDRFEKSIGVEGALFFRVSADGIPTPVAAHGRPLEELMTSLQSTKVTSKDLNEQEMLLHASGDGKLLIASHAVDATGQGMYLFAVARPQATLLKGGDSKDTSIFLYDSNGRRLSQTGADQYVGAGGDLNASAMLEITKELLSSSFQSGVREWNGPSNNEYILSYERLGKTKFTIVASVPKATAFAAAHALVQRSFALGVSILLVAIGMAMLFVKGLTRRIRELWTATRKVAEGDFSVRVETNDDAADEVNSLGQSFNTMADKIDELMAQTAEKARMEKELETAQVVQSRFFPTQHFSHNNMNLSGRVVPASECGGDWWFYAPVGNRLLVVVGDVTGHGVSSALVTAAVHGGFTMLIQKFQKDHSRPSMKEVIETLNTVVYSAAKQEATMTFVASLIDLDSGEMEFVNASHRPPYVYRNEKFKPLMDAKCVALGHESTIQVESATVYLEPGDVVLWYTDGVLECTNPEGKTISRSSLVKMVKALNERHAGNAPAICEEFMQETLTFFGPNAANLADDVTVVFGAISPQAPFQKKQLAA